MLKCAEDTVESAREESRENLVSMAKSDEQALDLSKFNQSLMPVPEPEGTKEVPPSKVKVVQVNL